MFKKQRALLLWLALILFLDLSKGWAQDETKKYYFSICAIFRNEEKYLKEWIEYHRLVGVDHFYLYNNGSVDGFREVLYPYIRSGIVTLIHWPDYLQEKDREGEGAYVWALSTQVAAYGHALKVKAVKETEWLTFLNTDEFLLPPSANKLSEILEKYEEYPAITLSVDFFDASKAETWPKKRLLIESVALTRSTDRNIFKEVEKTIFKPDLCEGFLWPPYQCVFKDNQQGISLRKIEMRINCYTNRSRGYLNFATVKDKLHVDNRMLSEEEITECLELGYEIEDRERAIYRFVPTLLTRMGYDPGWNW